MRKASIGRSSIQQPGVLRPRNGDSTPNNRLSAGLFTRKSYVQKMGQTDSAKRVGRVIRRSAENGPRSLLVSSRFTPTRLNTPAVVPQSANRMTTDSCRSSGVGTSTRKDSRPINDPAYKTQCITKILEFLNHNGFQHSIQRRTLNTPTTKDFTSVFSFIMQQLDPLYVLPPRYEEEIPKLLKKLKYTVQMTKSSFVTVGSPHTWPAVLAMLVYTVDIIIYYSILSQDSPSSQYDFDEDEEVKSKSHVFEQLYKCNSDEEMMACFKECEESQRAYEGVNETDMMEFQKEVEAAEDALESLPETCQELQQLQQCYSQYSQDLKKLNSYCQDLQVAIRNKTTMEKNVNQKLEELNAEKIKICEEVTDLKKLQAQQNLSSTDLIHFKNHSQEVGKEIEQQENSGNDLQNQIWSMELEISRAEPNLRSCYGMFEDLLKQLSMSDDFSDVVTNYKDLILHSDDIMFKITTFKKAAKKKISQAQSKRWELDQESGRMKGIVQEKFTENKKLETKIRHIEEEYNIAQEETGHEAQVRLEEIELLHQQIMEGRKTHKKSFYQLQRTLEDKKTELENFEKKKEACLRDGSEFLMKILHLALQSLEFKESMFADISDHINAECEQLLGLLGPN